VKPYGGLVSSSFFLPRIIRDTYICEWLGDCSQSIPDSKPTRSKPPDPSMWPDTRLDSGMFEDAE
jgi:hypothetical protein